MNFVSYAQNFEDVMLWRALAHIKNGFYIDVGAQHPVIDSVSLAFYEHGWRGVHIEPTQQYSSLLKEARPEEKVLQLAIGNPQKHSKLKFFEFPDTGLSTADSEIAQTHQINGFKCRVTEVDVLSLDTVIQQVGSQDIHWLKIDVEGLEQEVLESWQEAKNLPWIVVVESTRPLTPNVCYEFWEKILLSKGYTYVYFDGLNRFYISPEHFEIAHAFSSPPNIFDGFMLSGTASQPFYSLISTKMKAIETKAQEVEAKAQEAEAKAQEAETKAQEAEAKAEDAQQKAHNFEQTITAIYSSRSWRITYPMRWSFHQARLLRELGFKKRSKAATRKIAKPILIRAFNYVDGRPQLRHKLLVIVHRLGFYARLKSIYYNRYPEVQVQTQQISNFQSNVEISDLSPRVQQIYSDLKKAIAKNGELN